MSFLSKLFGRGPEDGDVCPPDESIPRSRTTSGAPTGRTESGVPVSAEQMPGAAVLKTVRPETSATVQEIPKASAVQRVLDDALRERQLSGDRVPVGESAARLALTQIDDAAVEEAVDFLFGSVDASSDEVPRHTVVSGDVRAVRETFDQLSALHMTRVRDLMLELTWGDPTPSFLAHCEPAVHSLRDMAVELEIEDLQAALARFEAALSEAGRGAGSSAPALRRESLLAAYEGLVALQPSVFRLQGERDRREPIIVDGLLRQVAGVHGPTLGKLAAAGLNRLEALARVEASDLSAVAEIGDELAARISEQLAQDREESSARLTTAEPDVERQRLESMVEQMVELRDALAVSISPAPEARARRRQLRSTWHRTWQRTRVGLARLGAVEAVGALDRLSADRRLRSLDAYLAALAELGGETNPASVRVVVTATRSGASREQTMEQAARAGALERADLRDVDLSNADLAGVSLRSAELEGADLGSADLRGALLRGANLREAHLAGADLRDANLQNVDLTEAVLVGADLTGADLTRANLEGANLEGTRLGSARLSHVDLGGADLSGAVLSAVELSYAELDGASLEAVDLSGADLRFANLTGACLEGARLNGARIGGLKGTGRAIERVTADWVDAGLDGARERLVDGEIHALLTGLRSSEPRPAQQRYFGRGDVLRHARLSFESGARVEIDSLLVGCDIDLGDAAELIIGRDGVLADCRIRGEGQITVFGKFFERECPGISRPQRVVVCTGGTLVSTVHQAETPTHFAFEQGCKLRLAIARAGAHGQGGE